MKLEACVWCHTPVRVPDKYNSSKQDIVCSKSCKNAELAFSIICGNDINQYLVRLWQLSKGGKK